MASISDCQYDSEPSWCLPWYSYAHISESKVTSLRTTGMYSSGAAINGSISPKSAGGRMISGAMM